MAKLLKDLALKYHQEGKYQEEEIIEACFDYFKAKGKPDSTMALRLIDAKDSICFDKSIESFADGFKFATTLFFEMFKNEIQCEDF